ncbi:MAG: hypothetical protein ABI247_01295 [Rhodanobacter sp.]
MIKPARWLSFSILRLGAPAGFKSPVDEDATREVSSTAKDARLQSDPSVQLIEVVRRRDGARLVAASATTNIAQASIRTQVTHLFTLRIFDCTNSSDC